MNAPTKISELIPARTAGSLPSSRTEGLLEQALASDDIDEIKTQLVHVWAHYQSLEFILVGREENVQTIQNALASGLEQDVSDLELVAGYFATGAVEVAYANTHMILSLVQAGITAPDALRLAYPHLDHSDPQRELTDADIAAFLATGDDE